MRYDNGGAFVRVDVRRSMEMAKAILQIMDRRKVEVYTGGHIVHRKDNIYRGAGAGDRFLGAVVWG